MSFSCALTGETAKWWWTNSALSNARLLFTGLKLVSNYSERISIYFAQPAADSSESSDAKWNVSILSIHGGSRAADNSSAKNGMTNVTSGVPAGFGVQLTDAGRYTCGSASTAREDSGLAAELIILGKSAVYNDY